MFFFNFLDCCKITILSEENICDQKKLIDSAIKSDLTIKVQNLSFLGHKEILSTRNSVFETIISALPKPNKISSSIDIPDCDPNTFAIFLKYIYTQNVARSDVSKELLNVAHLYVDTKLKKICEDNLVQKLSKENVVDLLIFSTKVESEKLKTEASKIIADGFVTIKDQPDFQVVKQNPEAVEAIFNQLGINIDSLNKSLNVQKGV